MVSFSITTVRRCRGSTSPLSMSKVTTSCPCGGAEYAFCCGRFIDDGKLPTTAEELMRSRYCAFTRNDEAYVSATWSAATRPPPPLTSSEDGAQWLGLDVRNHRSEGDSATVEFIARYRINGRAHRLHEVSRFVREQGRWYYLDGSFPAGRKTP